MASSEESSVAGGGGTSEPNVSEQGKTKKKIKFPPGFTLIRLLKKLEKQVETNPRPDYLAKIATLKERIQRKRDEKRQHIAKKMLKKQRAFLLRAFIKKVKEFRYKVENAAADLPANVLAERQRLLQKYTDELQVAKSLDLDELVAAALEAANEKPAEPTTREERIKQKLILNTDLQKYLLYKPGASAYTAADLDIDTESEDSRSGKKRAAHKDAEEHPFFGTDKAGNKEKDDADKELAYERQSLFLESLSQKPKKKKVVKKKKSLETYKPKNRPGQRARQAMREGVTPGARPLHTAQKHAAPTKRHTPVGVLPARSTPKLPSKIRKPAQTHRLKPEPPAGSLHPSWEAKRQADRQRQATSFQGTKMKFDE